MIKVLVAERNQVLRCGIRSVLDTMPGCQIVAEASSTQQLLWCFTAFAYDILLIEAGFLKTIGLQTLDEFSIGVPLPRMIVHSYVHDPTQGLNTLRDGACGYLTSHCSPSEMREAISHIAMGQRYMDRVLAEDLASVLLVSPSALPRLLLSRDELRIHQMLTLGLALSGIAAQLNMSLETVTRYKARIMRKLEWDGLVELIHAALAGRPGKADAMRAVDRIHPSARASSSRPAHPAAPGYSPGPG